MEKLDAKFFFEVCSTDLWLRYLRFEKFVLKYFYHLFIYTGSFSVLIRSTSLIVRSHLLWKLGAFYLFIKALLLSCFHCFLLICTFSKSLHEELWVWNVSFFIQWSGMHTNTALIEANEEVFHFSDRISLGHIFSNNVFTTWLHLYYEDFCKQLHLPSCSPILLFRRHIKDFVLDELWGIWNYGITG